MADRPTHSSKVDSGVMGVLLATTLRSVVAVGLAVAPPQTVQFRLENGLAHVALRWQACQGVQLEGRSFTPPATVAPGGTAEWSFAVGDLGNRTGEALLASCTYVFSSSMQTFTLGWNWGSVPLPSKIINVWAYAVCLRAPVLCGRHVRSPVASNV